MDLFIPKETLDLLSYRSTLGQSLKQISLSATPINLILDDIAKYRAGYIDTLVQENLIGSRFKSDDSIMRKYEKTLANHGGFEQCYYQRDNLAYPIEVQLWCGKDYYFNLWSHQYVYKYKSPEIGKKLYQEYIAGLIKTEQDFQKRLEACDNGR